MSKRPPDEGASVAPPGGLSVTIHPINQVESGAALLGSLPVGARIILRCRADWRAATVAAFEPERVVLNVASPKGHSYRVRRPPDSALSLDGPVPVLGEGCWRTGLARYDTRW